jgi:ClpP class serine protease
MSYRDISTILKSEWLITPDYAYAMLPSIISLIRNESVAHNWHEKKPLESSSYLVTQVGSSFQLTESIEQPNMAVHHIQGAITKHDASCGAIGSESTMKMMQLADTDASVIAHIMIMDTPGGTVDGTFQFADQVASLKKPVYTLVNGLMASAGVAMAAHSKAIYANHELATIGSIGVMFSMLNFKKFLQEKGIEEIFLVATDSPDKNALMHRIMKGDEEAEKQYVLERLDPVNKVFHQLMKEGRPNIDDQALTGDIFYAHKALELGLIDGIATQEQVFQIAYLENTPQQ